METEVVDSGTESNSGTLPEVTPGPESGGGNPAWNDFLRDVPQSMHPMFEPHLKKWDSNVQDRIQQVHSQYADYKPFAEAGINKDLLNEALQVYNAINDNPQEVLRILNETYGSNQIQQQGQGQQGIQSNQGFQPEVVAEHPVGEGGQYNPEFARLQEMTNTMAQLLIQQENARQDLMADQELDKELGDLKQKFGDYDENFVLSYMNIGMSGEDAVKTYLAAKNEILSNHNRPPAPITVSGSGQLPSNAVNPAAMNEKDTKALVAAMMRATNSQGV